MDTKNTPRLSVAILARNCAGPLLATIESVRPIADQILVLDTGSSDDTIVAALQVGADVHRRGWDDDFAAARNACLEKATSDWILWLDAGETLAPDQADALRKFLNGALPAAQQELCPPEAYLLTISLPAAVGTIGGEQIARVRLHPNRENLRFSGRIRERLGQSLAQAGLPIESLPIFIERSARDHNPAVKAGKAQRNIRLADLQMAEQGPSADLHNCLGEAFQSLADPVRGAQHYRRALELATAASREQLESYYGLLTCLDGAETDRSAQLALCMEALERFPLDSQLLVALGGYLQALGHLELAMRAYDVAFRHGQIETQIWHLPDIRQIAAVCAATALQLAGKDDDARTLLEAAVRTCPQSVRLGRQLVELHVKYGRRDEALASVAAMPIEIGREAWSAAVRGACLARQSNWSAAQSHLQAALEAGCHERFCFRALVRTWLGLAMPAEAQSVLRVWQVVDSYNPEIAALADEIAGQLEQSAPAVESSPSATRGPLRLHSAESPAAHVSTNKSGTHAGAAGRSPA